MPDAGEVIARFRVDLGDSLAKIADFKSAIAAIGEAGGSGGIGAMGTTVQSVGEAFAQLGNRAQITGKSFIDMGASMLQVRGATEQNLLLLPQFAESLHTVSEHTATAADNMAVLQDALANPYPFQTIQQHLNETGQTWEDFNHSVGSSGVTMLDDIATHANDMHQVFSDTLPPVNAEMKNLMDSLPSVNAGMSELSSNTKSMGESVKTVTEGGGFGGGGFGGAMNGLFMGLGNLMMVMYLPQMIGSMVSGIQGAVQNITTEQAITKTPEAIAYTAASNMLAAAQKVQTNAFDAAFGAAATPGILRAAQAAQAAPTQWSWLGGLLGTAWGNLQSAGTGGMTGAFTGVGGIPGAQPVGAGSTQLITYADQLATNFAALNKVVQASPQVMQAQNDTVFAAMQHAPLVQQLADISTGAYQQAMMESTTRVIFSAPTMMGQFAPPTMYAPQYAPPPPPPPPQIVGPGTTYTPGQSQSIWNFISGETRSIWDFIGGSVKSIWDFISGDTRPPMFATGVENFGGGLAIVGEKGPELLSLPRGSSVYPGSNMPGGSGAGSQQTLAAHIYIGGQDVATVLAPLIVAEIRQQAGVRR